MVIFDKASKARPFLFSLAETRDYAKELTPDETWLVSGGNSNVSLGEGECHGDPNGSTCYLSTSGTNGSCSVDDPTCDSS